MEHLTFYIGIDERQREHLGALKAASVVADSAQQELNDYSSVGPRQGEHDYSYKATHALVKNVRNAYSRLGQCEDASREFAKVYAAELIVNALTEARLAGVSINMEQSAAEPALDAPLDQVADITLL